MIIRLYDSMMTGNPVPEAKWVLRGRIVTNNTSPLYGNNENIQYVIHEKGECCSYDMDENHDIAIRYLRSSSSRADTDSVLVGGT